MYTHLNIALGKFRCWGGGSDVCYPSMCRWRSGLLSQAKFNITRSFSEEYFGHRNGRCTAEVTTSRPTKPAARKQTALFHPLACNILYRTSISNVSLQPISPLSTSVVPRIIHGSLVGPEPTIVAAIAAALQHAADRCLFSSCCTARSP